MAKKRGKTPVITRKSRKRDYFVLTPERLKAIEEKRERRIRENWGTFTAADGLDAIGKGEILRALDAFEQRMGRIVFDTIADSKAKARGLPELKDFWDPPHTHFHTIITAEPTYTGLGHDVRHEITARNSRDYTAEDEIEGYSLNRLIQMKRVVVPAITHGVNVLQSRTWAATRTFQLLRAQDEGRSKKDVLRRISRHAGNKLQQQWSPDLLLIPTIDDAQKVIDRLESRGEIEKNDNVIYENLAFQERLKPLFEAPDLWRTFTSLGTTVAYLNAGISVDQSRRQSVEIYRTFLETGKIPDKYRTPESALAA